MSYPRYTLNFIDTKQSPFKERLEALDVNSPASFEAVAAIARDAVRARAATVVQGSHTHLQATRNGNAAVHISHNDEQNDVEPMINVVIF